MFKPTFVKVKRVSFITCFLLNHLKCSASAYTMKAVQFEAGGPEKMYVGEVSVPSLREKEVLIKVYGTAINRADVLQRLGKYPPPPGESDILGLEASGVIEKLGPSCSGRWKVGDRVMALLSGGGNAEYAACYEDHLMGVPQQMSLITAAAIPEVWLTAYQLLHFVGKLKAGQSVLIHAGGSGVGTAATQLTQVAKGTAYVTAGSQEKINFSKSLGAKAGFNYKEEDFAEKITEISNGKGVDMILDCVGSKYWEQNVKSLSLDGTWVQYGLLSGGRVEGDLLASVLRKRITLVGSTLRARSKEYKKELVESFSREIVPLLASNSLKPVIHTVLEGLDKISEAHTLMQSNTNTGKIVIKVRDDDKRDEL